MTKKKPDENVLRLVTLLESLGWSIAIPMSSKNDDMQGCIIGTVKYIDSVLGKMSKKKKKR